MALAPTAKNNFQTLLRAAKNGDLALVECCDKTSGLIVNTVAAMNRLPSGEIEIIPLAKLFEGNPFDELLSPLQIDQMKVNT